MEKQEIALAILAGTEGLYAMSAFLPSLMTIDAFGTNPQAQAVLRRGELVAAVFAIVIGVTTSIIAESPLPILFTMAGLVAAIAVYEATIKSASGNGPIAQQPNSYQGRAA